MISVGHRRKKMEVKLVKIGPLIDNIIIIIIIIIIITELAERHPKLVARKKSRFFATDFQIAWPLERT